jgi:hypothetical protein
MTTGDDTQIRAALDEFKRLPGNTAYCIQTGSNMPMPPMDYRWNSQESLFCASAFKVFVLAAYHYYAERGELPNQPPLENHPSLLDAALAEPLTIQTSDHVFDSQAFGDVTGTTTARAILAAMIAYSDNTATDIAIQRVGVDNVRNFMYYIAGLNQQSVRIPNSTKAFYEYLSSQPTGQGHLINNTETMVCTADAFANFYQQALDDSYFIKDETRRQFQWFLSMSSAIPQLIPADMVCFMKGGSATYEGQNALAGAGQLTITGAYLPPGLHVQFAVLNSWNGEDYNKGVQAFARVFGDIVSALWWYAQRGS